MPKALRLKKPGSTNQKVITHFFKNTDTNEKQKSTSPAKNKKIKSSILPTKRKSISPLQINSNQDKEQSSDIIKISNPTLHVSKKHRAVNEDDMNIILKNHIINHENNDMSIDNSEGYVGLSSKSPQSTNAQKLEDRRSPLSCIDKDIVVSRGSRISPKCNFKSSIKENENHVNSSSKLDYFHKSIGCDDMHIDVITPEIYTKMHNHSRNDERKIHKSFENSPPKLSLSSTLEYCENEVNDLFADEWEVDKIPKDNQESLDLNTMQRCEITSVLCHPTQIELVLRRGNLRGTCFVEGIWLDTDLQQGEIVSIVATRNTLGQFHVDNSSGLIVLRPDYLLSSTSVVAGVFCKRKAVLQERWRGIDSANTAMTIGILIHELVQKALTQRILSPEHLRTETDRIIKESVQMLYDAGLCEDEARSNMQVYVPPLSDFMRLYVADNPTKDTQKQKKWDGHIEKVLDIEENLCCPELGLKGKIDATLEVSIHERQGKHREIVPLELKSGKASVSVEHRGQLVLYGMMLSLQRGENPTTALQRGLLLYLKERIELKEVSCGYPERRDLVMLRNQLVQHLAYGTTGRKIDDVVDIEEAAQSLPDPVHHETACAKCPYLTICSLHLWHTDGPKVSQSHPLTKLKKDALGHLSLEHIKYFLHWARLLKLEEKVQLTASPLHALWTDSVEKRVKRGTCAAHLKLQSVESSGDRYLHVFRREEKIVDPEKGNKTVGPQEGDFSIVSIENRPWIAAGVVVMANDKEINIFLERDLSTRQSKDTEFHIDTYESYATIVQNLTNLGVLIEDSDRASRLRSLIIDKKRPEFTKKLPREVGRIGAKIMRSLNIEQQRAVLKALAAEDYVLLQGLPGTGKTQTISVLIQMLVALKHRVLVTAHTHSAVDTVLSRLPQAMRVLRLGSSARVAPEVLQRCEERLTASCHTSQQLSQLYDSMEVVGVTCLGAAHAMLTRTSFDVCIVDEATQVLQCTVLRPLFAAKRFVLVGDPEQLPPVVKRQLARKLGMDESLFHRLMSEDATSTLRLQYRMNQALADLANHIAYNDRLKCANEMVAEARLSINMEKLSKFSSLERPWLFSACSPEPKYAAVFLNLSTIASENVSDGEKTILSNWEETCVVLALVEALKEGGVRSSDIGVIAPYRDQVSLLRRSLAHLQVEASTVDQFQGRDKSTIIFSCTKKCDSQQNKKVKEEEILNDQRRLAVSVTRAKHKLIVLGNSNALQRYEPLQNLINACQQITIEEGVINALLVKYKTLN